MHVVIFEGSQWGTFAPLSLSRPAFMLPCGMGTLLDKQLQLLKPDRLTLWVRPEFVEHCRKHVVPTLKLASAAVNEPLDDQPALLTSSRTLHLANFEMPHEPAIVVEQGDMVRFAYVEKMKGLAPQDLFQRSERWLSLLDLPHTMPQARYVDRVWDLISWNEEALITDFVRWRGCAEHPKDGPWHLVNPDDICIAAGAKLSPGCVIDASRGPVVLDAAASIGANAVLEGPCYIGQYTQIQPLAHIRAGTSIGAVCRIGGEVSNSIVSSYTNKAHYGYLGDSFVGSWVNLGAGTTTSNLKNTYGDVAIRIGSTEHKTGRRNLGSIIGDHTKTAIGTMLNTGSYVGYCCMLAGSGLAPKFTPSFTFWTDAGAKPYDVKKAGEVAERVYSRRDRRWTADDQAIMRYVAEIATTIEK